MNDVAPLCEMKRLFTCCSFSYFYVIRLKLKVQGHISVSSNGFVTADEALKCSGIFLCSWIFHMI